MRMSSGHVFENVMESDAVFWVGKRWVPQSTKDPFMGTMQIKRIQRTQNPTKHTTLHQPCSRDVTQAADGSLRVGQSASIKNLDFLPFGKLRKEQPGDATEVEHHVMRSVLGARGSLARESRSVSILQCRVNQAHARQIVL